MTRFGNEAAMEVNANTLAYSIILLLISISTANTACICKDSGLQRGTPIWEAPCGIKIVNENFDDSKAAIDPKIKRPMVIKSLKEIKQNLKLCLYFYKRQNYTTKANVGFPNIFQDEWLPKNEIIRNITVNDIQDVPKAENTLYTMLQKYSMMFTEMLTDDNDLVKQKFVKKVLSDLKSLLCDVQSSLIYLEERPLGIPSEIPKTYFFKENTEKHLRDVQIISMYGDFLKQWLQWIRSTRKQFRRKNQKKNRQPT